MISVWLNQFSLVNWMRAELWFLHYPAITGARRREGYEGRERRRMGERRERECEKERENGWMNERMNVEHKGTCTELSCHL